MKILNKKAGFEFALTEERIEAGLSLRGMEAKSLREGRGNISQSNVRVVSGEVFLINAEIPVQGAKNYDSSRARKILLHKNQIISLSTKAKQMKLQIVPLKLYNKGRLIKLELALGKPKRKFEKKESIKKKDVEREIEKEYKGT